MDTLGIFHLPWQFWGDDTRLLFPRSHSNGPTDEWGHCGYENDAPEVAKSFLKNVWRRIYPGVLVIHGGLFYNARNGNWLALTCRRPDLGYILNIENAGRGIGYDFTLRSKFEIGENLRLPEIKIYSKSLVQVLDARSGASTRTLDVPGPRGVALDASGNLYVVSMNAGNVGGAPRIVKFAGARGAGAAVVACDLVAPWDVAVAEGGELFVSDGGASQQIKRFSARGQLLAARGKKGGRPFVGRYEPDNFLHPAGVAIDARGGLLVAESSIPKVMSRFVAASGRLVARWFGPPQYWAGTWADARDPRTIYYQLPHGFARANLARPDYPQAYWDFPDAGRVDLGTNGAHIPSTVIARNGRQSLVNDGSPNAIFLVENKKLRPVATFRVVNSNDDSTLEVWQDANGDGAVQPGETAQLRQTRDGQPLRRIADWWVSTTQMTPNGDLYLLSYANKLLKIPGAGAGADGSLRWNLAGATYAVPTMLPALGDNSRTGRPGPIGVRVDSSGQIYAGLSVVVPGLTPELEARLQTQFPGVSPTHWGAYQTPALAEAMKEGLGHTADNNAMKIVKYDARGQILWMAGRKATAAARPGEMYHGWVLAGLVGDRYIAAGSEWGPITFYTDDGFFVDSLFENPGLNPAPGPTTFGGETESGRVQDFPALNQVWAYQLGMAYRVAGFDGGRVRGESRVYGTVQLDQIYDAATQTSEAAPLQIAPVAGAEDLAQLPARVVLRNGAELARVQLGYDARNLYGRLHLADQTPGQNAADTILTAFKGGDTVGIVLGPAPPHSKPGAGDVRLMVARIGGAARLIAMKSATALAKAPQKYSSPVGEENFEFVGEVPGGSATFEADANGRGYTVTFAVPRSFLEFDLAPGTALRGDVEVRLSGQGQSGLQATSRNYGFAPLTNDLTLTSDLPTEARIYPQFFGPVEIK